MGQHDLSYRDFFSHLRMIRDLLREIVGEQWVERIDFDSGELVNTSFAKLFTNRETDIVWKFGRKDGGEPVYVYILIEFQSRPDPTMPVRFMVYVGLFYQKLLESQPAARGKLPLVIPIVMNTGPERWNVATDLGSLIGDLDPSAEIYRPQLRYHLIDEAAYPREKLEALSSPVAELFRLETSDNWLEVQSSIHRLRQSLSATEGALREAFGSWLQEVIVPRLGFSEAVSAKRTLEEVETMLAESIDRWKREIREEGREEGLQEGRQKGLQEGRREEGARLVLRQLRLKFGALEPAIESRVRSADADRLLEWGERVVTAESLQDIFRD